MESAKELIEAFRSKNWKEPNIYNRVLSLRDDVSETYIFLEMYMREFKKGATFFNALLGYLDEEQLARLLEVSFDGVDAVETDALESLIDYISLMSPKLLRPYLEIIFKRDSRSYTEPYPWRDLDKVNIEKLKEKLPTAENKKIEQKIIEMLLQTRDEETVIFAYNYAKEHGVIKPESLIYYLEDVGYTLRDEKVVKYCSENAFHMVFQPNYLKTSPHPTWHLKPEKISYALGGEMAESSSDNPVCHMLTLEPVPKGLGISLKRVVFALHTRELDEGYEPFYHHNSQGEPTKLETEDEIVFEYSEALPPIKPSSISLASTPKYWQRQSWGHSNGRENLFRVGGEPTWIQSAFVPTCPKCKQKMHYLMQFDSLLPDISGGELWFGSGGIAYLFWCDDCCVSGYIIQFT